jgi:hypothetical protein
MASVAAPADQWTNDIDGFLLIRDLAAASCD